MANNIQAAIISVLTGDSALETLLGDRIFFGVSPEGTAFPLVVWEMEDQQPEASMAGRQTFGEARVLFTAWAKSFEDSKSIINQIDVLLGNLKQQSIGSGGDLTFIQGSFSLGKSNGIEEAQGTGKQKPEYFHSLILRFVFRL